ncbi:hypothetical protein [Nocardioides daphniae]|uniref:Uncharacterized protein n=1 Tax=Nocardioides daphniae TaxID=402297 RepID=A0A4P7UA83_9ACTN|nr:hypothetical protein [Nocardioides daphniae]QCC76992.1 hypothetical protein E2C04_06750 [Nocardioides daphniae]GGD18414.1 hypothetical protein GCM10007231_16910 [Nocardioides daphniae]
MSTEDEGARPGHDHEVGSLGEEALRLLGAVSGWVSHHGADAQHGAEEVVRQACEGVQQVARGFEEHLATGAPECTWCPICRTVHVVRSLSPEVTTHLGAAASSLLKAAAALMATAVPDSARGGSGHRPAGGASEGSGDERVQHIPLDDEPTP